MAVTEDLPETTTTSTNSVGATLRAAREAAGKDKQQVADALRIRASYIDSIESGRYAELPGGAYASGFVRAYADYMGLDSAEIVRRFKAETDGSFAPRADLVFPSPMSEGRIPGGAVLLVGLILASVAYGGWYAYSSGSNEMAEAVPALPERLAVMIQQNRENPPVTMPSANEGQQPQTATPAENAQPAAEQQAPASGEGQQAAENGSGNDVRPPAEEEAAAVPTPAMPASTVAAPAPAPVAQPAAAPTQPVAAPSAVPAPAPVAAAPTAPAAPVATPAPVTPAATAATPAQTEAEAAAAVEPPPEARTFGEPGGRVQLRAVGDSWIGVYEADGTRIASRTLRKGDVYMVPNREGLTLTVGSAGAISVVVDGQEVRPLGKSGIVRKNVPLDAESLRSQQ